MVAEDLLEEVTGRRVHICEDDEPLRQRKKKGSGPVKFVPNPSNPAQQELVRELQCIIATLNRENESIRRFMDWQSQRINSLEMRLLNRPGE